MCEFIFYSSHFHFYIPKSKHVRVDWQVYPPVYWWYALIYKEEWLRTVCNRSKSLSNYYPGSGNFCGGAWGPLRAPWNLVTLESRCHPHQLFQEISGGCGPKCPLRWEGSWTSEEPRCPWRPIQGETNGMTKRACCDLCYDSTLFDGGIQINITSLLRLLHLRSNRERWFRYCTTGLD